VLNNNKKQDNGNKIIMYCRFYLISSKKSEEVENGLNKITLGSENRTDAHGFIWIDKEKNIQQIQLLFGEIVLEWFPNKGVICSKTNRTLEIPEGIGFHKGVRNLYQIENKSSIEIAMEEAQNAEYPPEWSEKILEKF